jgi:uncharacterized membrane protein YraQ (UPF0718 family)
MYNVIAFAVAFCLAVFVAYLTDSIFGFGSILISIGAFIVTLIAFGLYQQAVIKDRKDKFDRQKEKSLRSDPPSEGKKTYSRDFEAMEKLHAWERQKWASLTGYLTVFGFLAAILVWIAFEMETGIMRYGAVIIAIGVLGFIINGYREDHLFSESRVEKLVSMWVEEIESSNTRQTTPYPLVTETPDTYSSGYTHVNIEKLTREAEELVQRIEQYESRYGKIKL